MGRSSHAAQQMPASPTELPSAIRTFRTVEGMDIDDVLAIWSPARLAEICNTSTQNVSGWIREGRVPRSREYELQVKSRGKLQASTFDPDRDYMSNRYYKRRTFR